MKKTSAAIVLAPALVACGGGTDTEVPATTPDSPVTPFNNVVGQADDVANAVNQRTADLESQLNN